MKVNSKEAVPMKKESLIKYSTPFLVSVVSDTKKAQVGQNSQAFTQLRTEELLNIIIKPLEFRLDNHQLWRQTVLSTPATKTEVINLEDELDKRLIEQRSKQQGLCSIRQSLYDECFDELIRQITIDCKQRGLLLVKVRDEIKQQMSSYQKIYESSVAYGMRKLVDQESHKISLQKEINQMKKEEQEITIRVKNKQKEIQTYKEQQDQHIIQKDEDHQQVLEEMKKKNIQIKIQMDDLLGRK